MREFPGWLSVLQVTCRYQCLEGQERININTCFATLTGKRWELTSNDNASSGAVFVRDQLHGHVERSFARDALLQRSDTPLFDGVVCVRDELSKPHITMAVERLDDDFS